MPKSNERGFVVIFPVLVVAAILLLSFTFKSFKTHAGVDPSKVLSESDSEDDNEDDSDNSGSGSANSGSSNYSETSKPSSSPESSTPKPLVESQSSTPKPQFFTSTKTVKFNSKEHELKKKLEKPQTPKASFKPNQTVKPEPTEKPELEDEDENEDETEKEDSTPEPSGVPGVVKIKFELKSENGQLEFEGEQVSPSKDSPVSVDEKTGALTITTPSGEKTVTFLPEDAVKSILGSQSVNEISKDEQTGKSELKLTINSNGVPVYEVEGLKKGRFLGIFSVNIKKTVQISAIDGAEGSVTVSGFDRFLDLLSF